MSYLITAALVAAVWGFPVWALILLGLLVCPRQTLKVARIAAAAAWRWLASRLRSREVPPPNAT